MSLDYDGLFISNGPGDPSLAQALIQNVRNVGDVSLTFYTWACTYHALKYLEQASFTFRFHRDIILWDDTKLILLTVESVEHNTSLPFLAFVCPTKGAGKWPSPASVWDLHGKPDHCSGGRSSVLQAPHGQQVTYIAIIHTFLYLGMWKNAPL